jgi:uncharacterized SAM-binding protein YcdF (DUF218 family)
MDIRLKTISFWKWITRFTRKLLLFLGGFTFIAILFSFTDYPFWAYYWLGTHNSELDSAPDIIVLMGGGGMPGPDGLMRCYFAAETAKQYPSSTILIAIPADTSLKENSPELLMASELIMRGIDSARIFYEKKGYSTRTQAVNIFERLGKAAADTLALRIVTSPEHMFRSVAAFRKVGFAMVGGQASFEKDIEERLLIKKVKGAEKQELRGLSFRYNIWNYLKYEITVLREYCALVYYKIRGWI